MELGEIVGYIISAASGGGLGSLLTWKLNKRKGIAEVKSDEIENMRKAMQDFYDPLVERQNRRIAELEEEVKTLRDQLDYERTLHQKQIENLQKQIIDITRVLGLKANKQIRDNRGRYTNKRVDSNESD